MKRESCEKVNITDRSFCCCVRACGSLGLSEPNPRVVAQNTVAPATAVSAETKTSVLLVRWY